VFGDKYGNMADQEEHIDIFLACAKPRCHLEQKIVLPCSMLYCWHIPLGVRDTDGKPIVRLLGRMITVQCNNRLYNCTSNLHVADKVDLA
jgi:hypothetical protein